jgi:signal transduction histidine kinase
MRISDDGRGFDTHLPGEGHGLDSMRERAENIGGELEIKSTPGSGTTVELEMPLNQYRWWRRRLR